MQYITTAHQAELNASAVMRSWGFIDAVATTGGSDGGIDVNSRRALAQVKWRGGVAGRPDLQRLYGARGLDTSKQLFFFAASNYSDQAVKYADEVGIALFVYDPVGAVTAASKHARKFAAAPKIQTSPVLVSSEWGFVFLVAGALVLIAALFFLLMASR